MISEISPVKLAELRKSENIQLLDVREDHEVGYCRIDGSVHVPLNRLLRGAETGLDPEKETVCYCHHGVRSLHSAIYLSNCGFRKVHSLSGGINAWSLQVDPAVPLY